MEYILHISLKWMDTGEHDITYVKSILYNILVTFQTETVLIYNVHDLYYAKAVKITLTAWQT